MLNEKKINYLYKKTFDIITTNNNLKNFEEINVIQNNILTTKTKIFSQRDIYRDTIPNQAPIELLNILLDDNNNNIEGSLIGKTSNNKLIKKFIKIKLNYVDNSEVKQNNNITSISFYSDKLINSIPYNFDINGSYMYYLYRPDGITLLSQEEGDWYIDNESGLLVFNSNVNINISENNYIDKNNSPLITFYSYNGQIGLYPLTFNKSNEITIMNNLNINDNIIINKNIITSSLYLNNIDYFPTNSNNQIINKSNELYFSINNNWHKISNQDFLKFNIEQIIINNDNNIINNLKNISVIEISDFLLEDIYITLEDVIQNGNEKTIIMGQSISNYIGEVYINIRGFFLTLDGIGPEYMNIKFNKTGQFIKIISIISENNNIFGANIKYWQIIINNSENIIVEQSIEPSVNNYEILVYNNNNLNIIDTTKLISIIELDTYIYNDIYILLPNVFKPGIKKIIIIGQSSTKYLNNNNIIIYGNYLDVSGIGPVIMNLKLYDTGQLIELISIVKESQNIYQNNIENYWQITNGHFNCTDEFINNNGIYTNISNLNSNFDLILQEQENNINSNNYNFNNIFTNFTYDVILLSNTTSEITIDSSLFKDIIIIELSTYLLSSVFLILNNHDNNGKEQIIIMGKTVSKYINGNFIILSSKFITSTGNGPTYLDIEFENSGNYIHLMSIVTKNQNIYSYGNKFWFILTGSFDDMQKLKISSITKLIEKETIINPTIIDYKKIISYNTLNLINVNITIIELNQLCTNNIEIIIPLLIHPGIRFYIIMGESVNKYINNHKIILLGKFFHSNTLYNNFYFTKTGQYIELISIINNTIDINSINSDKYWQVLINNFNFNNNYFIETNYINIINNTDIIQINNYINNQYELLLYDNNIINIINIYKEITVIDLNQILNNDIYIILPILNNIGKTKIITLSNNIYQYLNNFKIYIYGIFMNIDGIINQYNIELSSTNQFIKLISVKTINNIYNYQNYWQIIINNSNNISNFNNNIDYNFLSNIITLSSNNTNYKIISYNNSITNTIPNDTDDIIILELYDFLVNDAYILLPTTNIIGQKKIIITGQSVNNYINGHNIVLYSYYINTSGQGPIYMNIRFTTSGQIIYLMSVVTEEYNSERINYWQILFGHFLNTDNYSISNGILIHTEQDPGKAGRNIINVINTNNVNILDYNATELVNFELLIYLNNSINIISLNKKTTIIELTQYLTSDIYIILPNIDKIGFYKYILLGPSINKYINNFNIIIYSKFMNTGGKGPIFMNIKMSYSGQSLYLISLKGDLDNIYGYNNKYWQIIIGHFHVDDYIIFQNNTYQYINYNSNTDLNTYVDPNWNISSIQTSNILNYNILTYDNLNITNNLSTNNIYSNNICTNNIKIYNNLFSQNINVSNNLFSQNISVSNNLSSLNINVDSLYIKELHNSYYTIYINNTNNILNSLKYSFIIFKLNTNLFQNKIINLENINIIGLKKIFLFDDTISKYNNNYNIQINSRFLGKFNDIDTTHNYNDLYNISTININKSGQFINLISMISEDNISYWFILP